MMPLASWAWPGRSLRVIPAQTMPLRVPKREQTGMNTGRTGKIPVMVKPGNGPHERGQTDCYPFWKRIATILNSAASCCGVEAMPISTVAAPRPRATATQSS